MAETLILRTKYKQRNEGWLRKLTIQLHNLFHLFAINGNDAVVRSEILTREEAERECLLRRHTRTPLHLTGALPVHIGEWDQQATNSLQGTISIPTYYWLYSILLLPSDRTELRFISTSS